MTPADFKKLRADFQKTHKSLASSKGDIRKSKVFFNWAGPGTNGQGYIDRLPRFGDAFKPPSQTALDREREEKRGTSLYGETDSRRAGRCWPEAQRDGPFRINCGYGNTDCMKLVVANLI